MYGPVPALPPHRPPARATVILLRAVFVAVAVLSLGLLAWATLLRAALVRRGRLSWWLFGGDVVVLIGAFLLVTNFPETDWRTDLGVGLVLLQIAVAVAYYLVVDVRAQQATGYGAGRAPAYGMPYAPAAHPYGVPQPPAPAPGYAQPQPYGAPGAAPFNPYARTETRLPQPGGPAAPPHPAPPPAGPYATPPDRPQPPQRIDRVRAELDELSDYLRKEEGR
ncbi:DUF1720 domain-containing protein [Streptomyces platensis]|uniref:DUF1720 domain-containing protein n=1 Tax=Streptomyces platensis TaxID=58346 RepID=UPI0038678255|nr:hypothetical protein OG962_14920 [Streptomyces platensis]